MLAIFLPYIVSVYIFKIKLDKNKIVKLFILWSFSIIAFLLSLYYSSSEEQIIAILSSLEEINYEISSNSGAILWLKYSAFDGFNVVLNKLLSNNYEFYILRVVLALIAYIPIYKKLLSVINNKLILTLILFSLVGSLLLFVVAIDWGRFIYIHLVSLFLLSFLDNKILYIPKNINITIIIFVIIYSLVWNIPHCSDPFTYVKFNIISFFQPYGKLFSL